MNVFLRDNYFQPSSNMKGMYRYLTSEGKTQSNCGITLHIAELMMEKHVVYIRTYADAETTYERQADGSWTRRSYSGKVSKVQAVKEPGIFGKSRVVVVK